MGRLGRLQKWVLRAAWDNDASDGEPDLTYPEIKVGYFGMPSIHPARDEWAQRGHLFEKSKLKDYAKVSATISRAVHLLADRRLVVVSRRPGRPGNYWVPPSRAEIRLTEEGVEVARHLPTQKPKAKPRRGQSVR